MILRPKKTHMKICSLNFKVKKIVEKIGNEKGSYTCKVQFSAEVQKSCCTCCSSFPTTLFCLEPLPTSIFQLFGYKRLHRSLLKVFVRVLKSSFSLGTIYSKYVLLILCLELFYSSHVLPKLL